MPKENLGMGGWSKWVWPRFIKYLPHELHTGRQIRSHCEKQSGRRFSTDPKSHMPTLFCPVHKKKHHWTTLRLKLQTTLTIKWDQNPKLMLNSKYSWFHFLQFRDKRCMPVAAWKHLNEAIRWSLLVTVFCININCSTQNLYLMPTDQHNKKPVTYTKKKCSF
jgi:hypothetical protein